MDDCDVLVIGAGLAGLTAAGTLSDSGRSVLVLDKSSGVGGRLATRRIGDATFDHGAQFFTVRSEEFAALVRRWRELGAPIERWSNGFAQAGDVRDGPAGVTSSGGDGHARHVVRGGVQKLAASLARRLHLDRPAEPERTGGRLIAGVRATAVWAHAGRWHVAVAGPSGSQVLRASALVCTPPVPQTLALFARGGTRLSPEVAHRLQTVTYDPCIALLAVVDGEPGLVDPGGVQFASGPVRWLADNARKGVSRRPAFTVHAAGDWSAEWYGAEDDDLLATLQGWLTPWLGQASVTTAQIKRWRYAQPRDGVARRTLVAAVNGAPVAFAGDAFGHARIEGAARSGLAAAAALAAAG